MIDAPFHIRRATADDAPALHALAAVTFPLACPPGTALASMAAFVAEHLSLERFVGYLVDPARELFVAVESGALVGYTMLVFAEPSDTDVAAAISLRPTVELSKCYTLESVHGRGIAPALVAASVDSARLRGVAGMWLGVSQLNVRANRFYEKNGFDRVGEKLFWVGDERNEDFVRERAL